MDPTPARTAPYTPHAVIGLQPNPPADVTRTTAQLNGSFVGNGEDTHYYFEWGTDQSYGHTTPAPPGVDAGSGSGPTAASVEPDRTDSADRIPLPRGRRQRLRDELRRRSELQGAVRPSAKVKTEAATGVTRTSRPAQRLLRRQRRRHPLLLRMGHRPELRPHDPGAAGGRRRLGLGPDRRLGQSDRTHSGDRIPLPPRRDQRRRHDLGRRSAVRVRIRRRKAQNRSRRRSHPHQPPSSTAPSSATAKTPTTTSNGAPTRATATRRRRRRGWTPARASGRRRVGEPQRTHAGDRIPLPRRRGKRGRD